MMDVEHVQPTSLFRHPASHPIALDLWMLTRIGPEWLGWEPETVALALREKKQDLSAVNETKLQACKTLHLVDSFWEKWEIFLWSTMSLNGLFPDFGTMQVPNVAQCLLALDCAKRIRDDVEYSPEVKTFLSVVFKHDGVFLPLEPAEFVPIDYSSAPFTREAVMSAWQEAQSGKAPDLNTVMGTQIQKLLNAKEYLEESRARLHEQLVAIDHG